MWFQKVHENIVYFPPAEFIKEAGDVFSHAFEKRLHSLDLLNMGKCRDTKIEKISGKILSCSIKIGGTSSRVCGGHIAHGGPPTRESLPGLGRLQKSVVQTL